MPGIIKSFKSPIGPNQVIDWQDGPSTRTSDKPNIIVILVDDMGYNEVSSYGGGMGNGQFKTPNIDQLAADGALCRNGYATTAVCAASRASLLTGRNSTRFGFEYTPSSKGFGKFIAEWNKESVQPYITAILGLAKIDTSSLQKTNNFSIIGVGGWFFRKI